MVAPRIQIYVDESIHDSLGFIVSAFVFSKDRLDGRVVEADFRSIGIAAGKSFQLRCRDNTFNVLLGRGFGDVPLGEWVAFLSAQGARSTVPAAKASESTSTKRPPRRMGGPRAAEA